VLVETPLQLTTLHEFYGKRQTLGEYVRSHWGRRIRIFGSDEFQASQLNADVIFLINVLDVTPPEVRTRILKAAHRNLCPNGRLIAIVPRNETHTLRLCTKGRAYLDGFAFERGGSFTFYRNWPDGSLNQLLTRQKFTVEQDFSRYHVACLICRKQGVKNDSQDQ